MISEETILAAVLNSRMAYEELRNAKERVQLGSFGAVVMDACTTFYDADRDAQHVARDVLRTRLGAHFPAPKMATALLEYFDAIPAVVSVGNVVQLSRHLSAYRVGLDLADALTRADRPRSLRLASEYLELAADAPSAALADWKSRLTADDLFGADHADKIACYPAALNARLHGGIRPGHAALIFGRPGAGKTLVTVNMVAGMAHAGHTVLYVGNEEPLQTLQQRFLSRLGHERLWDLDSPDRTKARAAYERAEERALRRGWDRVHLLHGAFGMDDLLPYIERVRPDVLVLDQIRHIGADHSGRGEDNLTTRLEAVCRRMREMAHEHQLVAIGVSQAGSSAHNRAILTMTDLDSAKTGAQGAVDLIVGVGVTTDLQRERKRMLTLCRNKITGREETFAVWIDEQYTKCSGKPLPRSDRNA